MKLEKTTIPFDINPKHIYNEISEEIGLICPKYNSIKSQISRYNKKKNNYLLIYQNLMKFHKNIYVPEINSFYTTSLSILNNKEQATYELLFEELKKNASKYNTNIIVTPKNFAL
ncbi:hypothetical protein LY90DRAFT_509704 [Neocallimastix californiae]|uniref:Uncharacterized protein n=1 Tax=Neocallimastix californiae TaxID=1754190 RepID=A0A1Y2CBJ9_9FUNG|nr:hypothetical protein LY90DRAFT_509704 [Neocallimastix californiae]|eukprot:ORY44267.1 hypothetical protein LY90DRAFT_509704 [Neocallimastix californiae]